MKTFVAHIRAFVKRYPELLSIPVAFAVWMLSVHVLRWIDPTSGVFDAGVFQIPIFAVIQLFVFVSIAWLLLKLIFGTIRHFLENDFKNTFQLLTPWEQVKLSFFVFFCVLASVCYLARTLVAS